MKRNDLEKLMVGVFSDLRPNAYVDIDTKIKEDLNIDSLELFSACIEIEERTKLEVCKYISSEIITINDLLEEITQKKRSKFDIDYSKYPKKKDEKKLSKILKFLDKTYDVRVSGIENISDKKQLICPNHESNYDPFMVLLAFYKSNISMDNFCCFASEDVWNSTVLKKAFDILGAIPLFRNDNTSLALKRATEVLSSDAPTKFLIHPEGKRSRDGKLAPFKNGAQKLSEETNTEIVPVCINGTFEVYPYGRKVPKVFGHHVVEVKFLPPVKDGEMSKVRDAIKAEKTVYKKSKLA